MKFVSKSEGQFWVEDYNEQDKEFFLSIGFYEKKHQMFTTIVHTLYFKGTGAYGFWTEEEAEKICEAIYEHYPEMDEILVHENVES